MDDDNRITNFSSNNASCQINNQVPLEIIGIVADYIIGLVSYHENDTASIRLVLGPAAGNRLYTVSAFPNNTKGNEKALICALAVLRTIKILYNQN